MATRTPRKPRSWLDAIIAASLRWNDRLGRSVGLPPPGGEPGREPGVGGAAATPASGPGIAAGPGSRTR